MGKIENLLPVWVLVAVSLLAAGCITVNPQPTTPESAPYRYPHAHIHLCDSGADSYAHFDAGIYPYYLTRFCTDSHIHSNEHSYTGFDANGSSYTNPDSDSHANADFDSDANVRADAYRGRDAYAHSNSHSDSNA